MKFSYNATYTPPAPSVEIRLGLPSQVLRIGLLPAFVDTGADATLVPMRYLKQLGAKADDHKYLQSQ